jgi:hypothetical protein
MTGQAAKTGTLVPVPLLRINGLRVKNGNFSSGFPVTIEADCGAFSSPIAV